MNPKRGQLTVFFIIILVIFILGFLVIRLRVPVQPIQDDLQTSQMTIDSFVTSCLEKTTEDGISYLAVRGGYYQPPRLSDEYYSVVIPYYWYYNESLVPDITVIEAELFRYIQEHLNDCIDDFKVFKDMGYDVEYGLAMSEPAIKEDSVFVEMNFPVTLTKEGSSSTKDRFSTEIRSDFYYAYSVIKEVIEEQKKDPDMIMVSSMARLSERYNFTFHIDTRDDAKVIHTISFKDDTGEEKLQYNYLAQYDWSDLQ
ncbi:MAG: hypothetical protein KKE20_05000 [Nanoarchaeota archaeon]|nr:hypothetical protein [Nanoarchaeota archaeon]